MNTVVKYLLFIYLISLLVGCEKSKLASLKDGDVILAFGDSLTVGVGTTPDSSYPSELARLTGLDVVNAGVSGETTAEGLVRFPVMIEKYKPSLVILLEGGNDILRNRDYASIANNLDKMIQIALGYGVQVVLIGVPEKRLFSSVAPFYGELAHKYDLVFEPDLIGDMMRSPSKKSDAIHFNKAGYADLAQEIYDLLSRNGAFKS